MTKKKIFLTIFIILLLVIPASILFVIYGIGDTTVFLKLDDYTVEQSHFTYYCTRGYDEAYRILNVSGDGFWSADIEGTPVEEWVKEFASDQSKRYLYINKLFDDYNLVLEESDIQDIEETVYDQWHFNGRLAIYGPMGVDEEAYTEIITTEKKLEKLTEYNRGDLEGQITDDAIEAYLSENYASFRFVTLAYVDEEENSMEGQYEEYCQQVRNGKPLEELAQELEESGSERIKTSISVEEGRTDIAVPSSGSSFPMAFVSDLFQADIGEVLYFDDTANMTYNIAQRTDILDDSYFYEMYRDEITSALLSEHFEETLAEGIQKSSIDSKKRAINKFSVRELYE